jgi:hypothetical protein
MTLFTISRKAAVSSFGALPCASPIPNHLCAIAPVGQWGWCFKPEALQGVLEIPSPADNVPAT